MNKWLVFYLVFHIVTGVMVWAFMGYNRSNNPGVTNPETGQLVKTDSETKIIVLICSAVLGPLSAIVAFISRPKENYKFKFGFKFW